MNMWKVIVIFVFIFSLFNVVLAKHAAAPRVNTLSGSIYGKVLEYRSQKVHAYLGVPFATPPLGNLRFQRTRPVRPWVRPIQATRLPPACHQYTDQPIPWSDRMPCHNEDCLYLNVYVPARITSRLRTVMFWIFGGDYALGSSRLDDYDGRSLAVIGDLIVVTVNYRVGPLGFLYSNSTDSPGNMGIYDIYEALKWVNRNIEYFGGDKNDITIFGQSVGATTVGIFTISPLTKHLYKRAIMESFPQIYLSDDNADKNIGLGQKLAKAVNCASDEYTLPEHPSEVIACLRSIPAARLVKKSHSVQAVLSFMSQSTGGLVPRNSLGKLQQADFKQSELLIGYNTGEGSVIVLSLPKLFGPLDKFEPKINKTFAEALIRGSPLKFNADRVISYYFNDVGEYDYKKITQRFFGAIGDLLLICGTVFFGQKFALHNNVYFYVFDHRPSNSPWAPDAGVAHFDEVPFVFGEPTRHENTYYRDEVHLSERMMRYWTSFAKHGVPDVTWPLYSERLPVVRLLNTTFPPPSRIVPHLKNCNFIRQDIGF